MTLEILVYSFSSKRRLSLSLWMGEGGIKAKALVGRRWAVWIVVGTEKAEEVGEWRRWPGAKSLARAARRDLNSHCTFFLYEQAKFPVLIVVNIVVFIIPTLFAVSQVPLIWTNNKSTHNSFSTALQRLIKSCISHTLAPHPISNPDRRHPAWTAARPPSSDSRVYEEQEPPTSIRHTVTSTSASFIEVIERVILGDLRVTGQNPAQLRALRSMLPWPLR